MNVQIDGAPRRPKLSLPFGRPQYLQSEAAPALSGEKLRRIVAEMIG